MKNLIFTSACLLLAGIASAQVSYRSLGEGTADLGVTANWDSASSPLGPWGHAPVIAPGKSTMLGNGSIIVINKNDVWNNTLTSAFPAQSPAAITGVTIIDSSTAIPAAAFSSKLITAAGSKIIFAGGHIPYAGSFSGNAINCDVDISGNTQTANGSLTLMGNLILTSGIFTCNNGGGSLYVKGSISANGGYMYAAGYVGFNGTGAQVIPDGIFSTSAGIVNNQITKLIVNNNSGVTASGPLYTPYIQLASGTFALEGTLTMGGGYGTNYTLTVGNGYVDAGNDTVVFKPVAAGNAQSIPAGFFENNSIANLHISNTSGVTYGADLGISNSLAIDNLGNTVPLSVNGACSISGKLVIGSFATPPAALPATYTVLSASGSLSGTFSSVSLPSGYNGTVSYNTNSVTLTITAPTQNNNTQFKLYNWIRYNNAPAHNYYLSDIGLSLQNLTNGANAPDFDAVKSFAASTTADSVVTVDIETWSYATDSLSTTVNRFISVIDTFKSVNPNSLVGYYGAIPQQKYEWGNINTAYRYNNWMKVNDSLIPAAAKVDVFFPSAYCRDTNTVYWQNYIDSNVSVIRSLYSATKPVYVYISPQYNISSDTAGAVDKQFIDTARWKKLLNIIYDSANGAVIWTSNKDSLNNTIYWNDTMAWWTATKEFLLSKGLAAPYRMDTAYAMFSGDGIGIHWATSIDTIATYFQVEKSADGVSFQPVSDSIASLHSNCQYAKYDFTDSTGTGSKVYYRLKVLFANDSVAYSAVFVYTPSVHYKSIGSGALVDLGSPDNWLVNNGNGWTAASNAPGSAAGGLSSGGTITISPSDIWSNNIASVQLMSGVSLIDSSSAGLGTFGTSFPISTAAGSTIIFCGQSGTQYIPSFAYFTGKTINSDIVIDNISGVQTTSPSAGAVSGTMSGLLILKSGVLTSNNGGGTFNYSGTAIEPEGGSIYANGYFAITGNNNFSLPANIFSNAAGMINNTLTHLNINVGTGKTVSTSGTLIVNNRIGMNSGTLALGGNLIINGAAASSPLSVGSGSVYAGDDTVIFNNASAQTVPANFFYNNSINNIEIRNTNTVSFSTSQTINNTVIIDQLVAGGNTPLIINGTATVNATFVIKSFLAPPSDNEEFKLLYGASVGGAFNTTPVLPAGYSGVIYQDADTLVLKITNAGTLPLKLLDFVLVNVASRPALKWSVADVSGTKYFLVQQSFDGVLYQDMDTVQVGSTSVIAYTYPLESSEQNNSYFRLKIVGMDGGLSYSPVVKYDIQNNSYMLYPNPVANTLYIRMPDPADKLQVVIYNITGNKIRSFSIVPGVSIATLDVSALIPGNYFVIFERDGKMIFRSSLIKK